MSEIVCVICENEKGNNNYIQPRQIGVETLNRASIKKGDKLNVVVGDYVHVNCRKEYLHVTYGILHKLLRTKTNSTQTGEKTEVHNHNLTLKQSVFSLSE